MALSTVLSFERTGRLLPVVAVKAEPPGGSPLSHAREFFRRRKVSLRESAFAYLNRIQAALIIVGTGILLTNADQSQGVDARIDMLVRVARGANDLRWIRVLRSYSVRSNGRSGVKRDHSPGNETPGAEQAGVVYFIDAALAGYDHDQVELYRQGLSDVTVRSRKMFSPSNNFRDLSEAQRIAVMESIQNTEFFDKLRTHTILAYFGNPQFGWKLMERDPAMHFEPPFGFYDGEIKAE